MTDDIQSAKETFLIKENEIYDIVFPGDGGLSSPGKEIPFFIIEKIDYFNLISLSKLFRFYI